MSIETSPKLSATLFLRADPEPGAESQRRRTVERVSALETEGLIDAYEIVTWGRELRLGGPLEGTDYHRTVLEHVEAFEEWASRNGRSLAPLFRRRQVSALVADETYESISLPIACLAVYRDGELDGVYPCRNMDGACSVHEFLDRLEANGGVGTTDKVVTQ